MALKSAELAGLRMSEDSMQGAFNFTEEVTDKTSGHVGYTKREEAGQQVKAQGKNDDYMNHPALSAVAMCVRTFVKHNPDDPMLEAGAKLIMKDLPVWDKKKKSIDYYYWYYASLALNQYDGPDSPKKGGGRIWDEWNKELKKALLDNQVNNQKLCSDGSWDGDEYLDVRGLLPLRELVRHGQEEGPRGRSRREEARGGAQERGAEERGTQERREEGLLILTSTPGLETQKVLTTRSSASSAQWGSVPRRSSVA
jgi:hypothetical protein